MNIRSQKGFTGADVTVAVLILTVFSAIIVTLYQNYISTTKQIERKMSICDMLLQTIDIVLQQAEALRQSILKKAFNGELI